MWIVTLNWIKRYKVVMSKIPYLRDLSHFPVNKSIRVEAQVDIIQ